MAEEGTFTIELTTDASCSAELFYETFKCGIQNLALVLPEVCQSVEVVEGDGQSVDSVRVWNYVIPENSDDVFTIKEKIDLVDDENMCIVLSVLEGHLVDDYTQFLVRMQVAQNGDGEGCLVNWCIEHGEVAEGVDDPQKYLEFLSVVTEKVAGLADAGSQIVEALSKVELTTEASCSAALFYEMFKCGIQNLTLVLPEVCQSVEVLEGDGQSVDSVRLWTFVLPESEDVMVIKEKIDVVDDENMCIVLSALEGTLVDDYTSFLVKMQVVPNEDGEGCLVNWCIEHGAFAEGIEDLQKYLDFLPMVSEKVAALIDTGSKIVDIVENVGETGSQIVDVMNSVTDLLG